MRWDLLIILFAIWNCIQVPYSLAFDVGNRFKTYILFALIYLQILYLLLMFIINFLTTYISEETGIESFSFKEISIQYFKKVSLQPNFKFILFRSIHD